LEPDEAGKSPAPKTVSSPLAEEHARLFFEFREQAARQSDILARRQMSRLYQDAIAPKIYSGVDYDEEYHTVIDGLARKRGWESIIEAYVNTPGH